MSADLQDPSADPSPDLTADPPADPHRRYLALLAARLGQGQWLRLVLAKPQAGAADLQRAVVRPLTLRGQACLSFVFSHATRDITKNLPVAEGLAQIGELLGATFRNAHLFTPQDETQLTISKKGKGHISVNAHGDAPALPVAPAPHDREKQRWLELSRPFLAALGVTTPQHQLVPAMASKWRQINKFVEVFAHALAASNLAEAHELSVVDFGAGKAYLTFALHDWLRHARGLQAQVTGIELRPDLVQQGQQVIADLGLQGMHMQQGEVAKHGPARMDVMIALHACDTATDHAIHLGVRAGASIILCSPCCHKQLRPQLLSPHPLRSVFAHGIHAEQQAEMVTDSLRALLLETQGYETQVFEFVSLEHTAKNKMILAIKREAATTTASDSAWAQVDELKRYFGVKEQALETLLRA